MSNTQLLQPGTILPFIGNTQKLLNGWFLCKGQQIPPEYLNGILGEANHFPNLIGRVLIGSGKDPNNKQQGDGKKPNFTPDCNFKNMDDGGEYGHTLLEDEIPSHTHQIDSGKFCWHNNSFEDDSGPDLYTRDDDTGTPIPNTNPTGGGKPHYNMQPFYVVHYIIFMGEEN